MYLDAYIETLNYTTLTDVLFYRIIILYIYMREIFLRTLGIVQTSTIFSA